MIHAATRVARDLSIGPALAIVLALMFGFVQKAAEQIFLTRPWLPWGLLGVACTVGALWLAHVLARNHPPFGRLDLAFGTLFFAGIACTIRMVFMGKP